VQIILSSKFGLEERAGCLRFWTKVVTEPPQPQCLILSLTFKATSVCILTFQSPFAQLVAEIGRHLQVIISDLSYSIIKIIPS